jgi:hypothetical protein
MYFVISFSCLALKHKTQVKSKSYQNQKQGIVLPVFLFWPASSESNPMQNAFPLPLPADGHPPTNTFTHRLLPFGMPGPHPCLLGQCQKDSKKTAPAF